MIPCVRRVYFLLIITTLFYIYCIYPKLDGENRSDLISSREPPNNVQRKKLILFVTPWFNLSPWPGAENNKAFLSFHSPLGVCSVTNCEVTYNMSMFHLSDLIVVHGAKIAIRPALATLQKLHKTRPKEQRWLWFMHESPMNTHYDVSALNGMFNWTLTYRRDSEIFSPYQFYYPIASPELSHVDYSLDKTRMVAWMSSNTAVRYRKDIASELIKFGVQLDVFGAVSRNSRRVCGWLCPDFFKAYKFYLAFENSYCKDYITEKYWRSLLHGMVPIVIGGGNYSDPNLAIPNSYINALDFNSVKELADYIFYLDQNNTAYNEYFSWKAKYKVGFVPNYCNMCKKINTRVTSLPEKYTDFSQFWGHNTCKDVERLTRIKLKISD